MPERSDRRWPSRIAGGTACATKANPLLACECSGGRQVPKTVKPPRFADACGSNRTSFNNSIAPTIGYVANRELDDTNDRRKYGLKPIDLMLALERNCNTDCSENWTSSELPTEFSNPCVRLADREAHRAAFARLERRSKFVDAIGQPPVVFREGRAKYVDLRIVIAV